VKSASSSGTLRELHGPATKRARLAGVEGAADLAYGLSFRGREHRFAYEAPTFRSRCPTALVSGPHACRRRMVGSRSNLAPVESESSRPLGPDGQPPSPEEAALALHQARRSRRWAYGAFALAIVAVLAAAALAVLFFYAEERRSSASSAAVQELQEDVASLKEELRSSLAETRSEAETSEDKLRTLGGQVERLDERVGDAEERADGLQQQVRELGDDFRQLSEDLARARPDGDASR
jgi:hypothetical protein